jgi:hypothetical protein
MSFLHESINPKQNKHTIESMQKVAQAKVRFFLVFVATSSSPQNSSEFGTAKNMDMGGLAKVHRNRDPLLLYFG